MNSGENLGPYRILEKIGEGGMGEVYRAHDSRLQRTVAIKVLAPRLATAERAERFEQEARAASALNHPNILTIHDVGRQGDTAYFAMEWVEGRTLRDELRGGPVPHRRTIQLAHQIAEGLATAHAAGIIHRDLKPENVIVRADGLAKIVDFGLAKPAISEQAAAAREADPTVTRAVLSDPGVVMGTVGYMSPEQASGRAVDYRSDQFALGLLIYELVTGKRPFVRTTTAQTLAATIEEDPPPLQSLRPDVPPHLAAVVQRLLSKSPDERYESTRDLARELKSLLETTSSSPAVAVADRRRGRLGYVVAGLFAIVLVAGAAVAAWLWRAPASAPAADVERPLLAVRPFRSLSPDPQQGYFAEGITEEIRGQLSQISALRLLSRNGLDSYKDDPMRGVKELGLRHLVDGSVRVEGNRVRVSAELVDASTQQTLWSDRYDRDLADVLTVQSQIAQQIARALHANLSPAEQRRIEKRPTGNLEAYTRFLQAQQASMSDRARNLEAIEHLRQALALDPQFALARGHLAYRLLFLAVYDGASFLDQAITEAEAAVRMDPSLSYGYFALGSAYSRKGLAAQARQAFHRALELDPNNTAAMNNFSGEEGRRARWDEAAYWGRRSFLLSGKGGNDFYHLINPLSNLRADVEVRVLLEEAERTAPYHDRIQRRLAWLEVFEGRVDRALKRADEIIARFPSLEDVKFFRAELAFLLDAPDLERWVEPLMERSGSSRGASAVSHRLKYAYALRKRGEAAKAAALVAEAERVARALADQQPDTTELRVELATVAAIRQDTTAALEWLGRAYEGGYRDYAFLERNPILRHQMGTDARFVEFIDRMRRDVAAQRERARARGLLDLADVLRRPE
jgi:TolB-like protein/tRNA A-37 threonylcarbamoyl transferase component Bud32